MKIRLTTLLLTLAFALAHTPAPRAQGLSNDQGWAAVVSLRPGTRVRVQTGAGETIKGTVSSVSATTLTLLRGSSLTDLERDKIRKVYRAGGRDVAKSTLIGLGVGAGVGAAIGAGVAASDDAHESGEAALPVGVFGAGGAIIGTAAGLVTGLLRRKEVLVYESR